MSGVIERTAKVLASVEAVSPFDDPEIYVGDPAEARERYRRQVRIVLQELREPTMGMVARGLGNDPGEGFATIEWLPDAWRAMIDAALAEDA